MIETKTLQAILDRMIASGEVVTTEEMLRRVIRDYNLSVLKGLPVKGPIT